MCGFLIRVYTRYVAGVSHALPDGLKDGTRLLEIILLLNAPIGAAALRNGIAHEGVHDRIPLTLVDELVEVFDPVVERLDVKGAHPHRAVGVGLAVARVVNDFIEAIQAHSARGKTCDAGAGQAFCALSHLVDPDDQGGETEGDLPERYWHRLSLALTGAQAQA